VRRSLSPVAMGQGSCTLGPVLRVTEPRNCRGDGFSERPQSGNGDLTTPFGLIND
jgi:hypothetical protein